MNFTNDKQSCNVRLSRLRDLKRHQLRVVASFTRSSNPSAYALEDQSVVPSGIVKAGDCETTSLDSNLLIAGRVRRRVDTAIRNRADGDLLMAMRPEGEDAATSRVACMYYTVRVVRISRNIRLCCRRQERMIVPRFAALRGESSPIIHRLG